MRATELNPRQLAFAQNYINTGNATQSYISAGYAPGSAEVMASKMLRNAKVADFIFSAQKVSVQACGIDATWVLKEAADLYQVARDEGQFPVAAKCLEIVGKHVDVRAFEESKQVNINLGDDSKWTIEVVHANHEERLIAQAADVDVIEHKQE